VRRLIVNADDFGFTSGVNQAIVEVTKRMEGGELKPDRVNLQLLTRHP
jgi:predicted glycoside hydrolase/deacetylase ChbG (UPF0249 family)